MSTDFNKVEHELAQRSVMQAAQFAAMTIDGHGADLDAFIRTLHASISHNESCFPITVARGMPVPDLTDGLARLRALIEIAEGLRKVQGGYEAFMKNVHEREALKAAGVIL